MPDYRTEPIYCRKSIDYLCEIVITTVVTCRYTLQMDVTSRKLPIERLLVQYGIPGFARQVWVQA